jgi:hypothetical protein
MIKKNLAFFLLTITMSSLSQTTGVNGWPVFARVKFTSRFFKELNEYFLVPTFDEKIKSLQGTEITVKGHYMPFDLPKNQLIVSKNPYSSCFFCGAAGPETVVEVILASDAPKLKVDQVITVKGKLKLNSTDVNHMNFILEEAALLKTNP